MKRRNFLIGAGGVTVALPMLRAFTEPTRARAGGAGAAVVRRVIVMAYPMGTHTPSWRPTATGSTFDLPMITAPLEPFKDRCLFVSDCGHEALGLGGNSFVYGHPAKKEAVFTGTLLQVAFGGDGSNHADNVINADPEGHDRTPNGPSIEHVIGQALGASSFARPSVDLGVWGPGGTGGTQPSDFFFEGVANPVTMQSNPATAFLDLFSGVTPTDGQPDEAVLSLLRRRKSVLDGVRDSFADLRSGLDPDDQRVLDEHAQKIREIELDMPTLGTCVIPDGIPTDEDGFDGMSMMELADLHNRIMAHALGCGVAPVGRIEYLAQQNPRFGIPTVDDAVALVQDWHHPIVHAADGIAPDYAPRLEGFRFFVQKFADLLGYLDAIPEGGEGLSVLDHTLVLLGSDFADGGGHASDDLGFIVAGNAGAAPLGYHLDAGAGGYNVNHFLTSVARMGGVTEADGSPVQSFGLPGFVNGPISELS
jgi:hypothetical protein